MNYNLQEINGDISGACILIYPVVSNKYYSRIISWFDKKKVGPSNWQIPNVSFPVTIMSLF
jgi:hypothetical protein